MCKLNFYGLKYEVIFKYTWRADTGKLKETCVWYNNRLSFIKLTTEHETLCTYYPDFTITPQDRKYNFCFVGNRIEARSFRNISIVTQIINDKASI